MTPIEHFIEYVSKKDFSGLHVVKIKQFRKHILIRLGGDWLGKYTVSQLFNYNGLTNEQSVILEKTIEDIIKIAYTYYGIRIIILVLPKYEDANMPF
jgi:hypothetical protein